MAWVSRTTRENSRVGAPACSTTGIGPGTYDSVLESKQPRPSYAPFGSTNVRNIGRSGTLVTPGPGTYDNNNPPHAAGSSAAFSAFRSKTTRNSYSKKGEETPGPGFYAQESGFSKTRGMKKGAKRMTRSRSDVVHERGMQFIPVPTAPSIPSIAQSFGYEEGPAGQLIPQRGLQIGHSGRGNDQVGPGSYSPNVTSQSPARSRAADFSRSRTHRSMQQELKSKASIPGPGAYGDTQQQADTEHKPNAIFKSTVKRANHAKTKAVEVPGPGSYMAKASIKTEKKPDHLQFFGSTSVRFRQTRYDSTPGPASYKVPTHSVKVKTTSHIRHPGAVNVGFYSTKQRFGGTTTDNETGPGSYDVPEMATELQRKLVGKTGVFGSSSKRFPYNKKEKSDPMMVEIEEEDETEIIQDTPTKKSSMFASSTSRFQTSLTKDKCPSPGSYDLTQKWVHRGGKGVLESGSKRFTKTVSDMPGPGSYEFIPSPAKHHAPVQRSYEERFKEAKRTMDVPGPGAYITDYVGGALNQPTFNVSIVEEMERGLARNR